mmetsp:Transcript_5938/g.9511  ORF Transcript_5938/g.9511 Transcript_5938/m.9511 type:complete len:202 (-) Transcript_5938:141-746(-)
MHRHRTNSGLLEDSLFLLGRQVFGKDSASWLGHDGRCLIVRCLYSRERGDRTAVPVLLPFCLRSGGRDRHRGRSWSRSARGCGSSCWRCQGRCVCCTRGRPDIFQLRVIEAEVGVVLCLNLLQAHVAIVHFLRGPGCIGASNRVHLVGHLLANALQPGELYIIEIAEVLFDALQHLESHVAEVAHVRRHVAGALRAQHGAR